MADRSRRRVQEPGGSRRTGGEPDAARRAAYDVLRAVAAQDAYANLVLPRLLDERKITGRDAALATELGYGTLRAAGTLDEIIGSCLDRPLGSLQPEVLDLLRLGSYQALRTRVPPHASVDTTIELARQVGMGRAAGLLNAVLRRVTADSWDGWTVRLGSAAAPLRRLALRTAHPEWIAAAFAAALREDSHGQLVETSAALAADDTRPSTHLVAWPGRLDRAALVAESGGQAGPFSPYAVRLSGGNPAALRSVRARRAAVQDEGSQLCAMALVNAPVLGRDARWLDLCAGPGGKAALLASLGADRGATVTAVELHPHRGELVRRATEGWPVEVVVGDARELAVPDGGYDRVLLDAPCTGLGALRRRPEARWRRGPAHLAPLVVLQAELLAAAMRLVRPGGVVGYVTCSPHVAETIDQVAAAPLRDARPLFPGVPELGEGPTVQLWPHRHGTDAMFFALLAR